MASGKTKPIERVKCGDQVISRDPITGKTQNKHVVRTFVHKNAKTLILRFASGEPITTTPGHPFFVQGKGFVLAGNLTVGNAIVTRAGPGVVLVDIEWHSPQATVYNFEVADTHTYFVGKIRGGMWVHNVSMAFDATLVMPDGTSFSGPNGVTSPINPDFQVILDAAEQRNGICAEVNVINQAFEFGYTRPDFVGAQLTVVAKSGVHLGMVGTPCSSCSSWIPVLGIIVTPGGW